MRVLICTYGRAARQTTWASLPESVRADTQLVIQRREDGLYRQYPTLVLPDHIRTIGATRQYLVESLPDSKVVMLDDDLVFAKRRTDEPDKFREAAPRDIEDLFSALRVALDKYAHAGVAPREGGNRNTDEFMFNTRMMRVLAYRFDTLRQEGVRFDRLPVMEDFDATLQLLRKGYGNIVLNAWCQNQGGSNTSGGCSTYRTPEIQTQAAEGLARLHPGFVTVVKKQTKVAWNGQERTDVRVQWKKAYDSHS